MSFFSDARDVTTYSAAACSSSTSTKIKIGKKKKRKVLKPRMKKIENSGSGKLLLIILGCKRQHLCISPVVKNTQSGSDF